MEERKGGGGPHLHIDRLAGAKKEDDASCQLHDSPCDCRLPGWKGCLCAAPCCSPILAPLLPDPAVAHSRRTAGITQVRFRLYNYRSAVLFNPSHSSFQKATTAMILGTQEQMVQDMRLQHVKGSIPARYCRVNLKTGLLKNTTRVPRRGSDIKFVPRPHKTT